MGQLVFAVSLFVMVLNGQQGAAPKAFPPSPKSIRKATPAQPLARNDIVMVADSLVTSGGLKGKGEFETTVGFDARIKEVALRYGQLSFLVPEFSVQFKYDADAVKMSVELATWLRLPVGASEKYGVIVNGLILRSRTVSNGPPAKLQREHGVFFEPSSPLLDSLEKEDIDLLQVYKFTFPMDVESARAMKTFLRAVIIGRLLEGRVYESHEHFDATRRSPMSMNRESLLVPFLIDEIRVIDVRSGKVLTTLPRSN